MGAAIICELSASLWEIDAGSTAVEIASFAIGERAGIVAGSPLLAGAISGLDKTGAGLECFAETEDGSTAIRKSGSKAAARGSISAPVMAAACKQCRSDAERRRLEEVFIISSRYEWMFWEMAWKEEAWPV